MNAIPDAYDYLEVGADAPEPDGTCTWCGAYDCGPNCTPWPRRDPRDAPDGAQGAERLLEHGDAL